MSKKLKFNFVVTRDDDGYFNASMTTYAASEGLCWADRLDVVNAIKDALADEEMVAVVDLTETVLDVQKPGWGWRDLVAHVRLDSGWDHFEDARICIASRRRGIFSAYARDNPDEAVCMNDDHIAPEVQ